MRASNPFAHDRRLDDPTRSLPTDSIRGRGVYPFSRRDLLRAGAAGLVGLGLPLVAPPRARATNACFPGGNVLFTGINYVNLSDPTNPGFGLVVTNPFLRDDGQLCAQVTNNSGSAKVLVWDIFDAPNANAFNCFTPGPHTYDFLQDQLLRSISSPLTVPNGRTVTCCTPAPTSCFQGDLGFFQADVALQNPAVVGTPIQLNGANSVAAFLYGGTCDPQCIRMTGGGGTILAVGGGTVETSQGFQLRTGPGAHSNLEVHWTTPDGTTHTFHSGPPDGFSNLRGGTDPSCGGGQPLNQPNMIFGQINGTVDGQTAATMFINFVDCGEPGTNDTRQIAIFDSQGNALVLAQGKISNGNNQAHKC